ncbi:MAG: hypothetical protein M1837_000748 [Sclerophora amabilis]|nr:MAG: hypothetical protein M1837_000748 [Sclerophora amabilis]
MTLSAIQTPNTASAVREDGNACPMVFAGRRMELAVLTSTIADAPVPMTYGGHRSVRRFAKTKSTHADYSSAWTDVYNCSTQGNWCCDEEEYSYNWCCSDTSSFLNLGLATPVMTAGLALSTTSLLSTSTSAEATSSSPSASPTGPGGSRPTDTPSSGDASSQDSSIKSSNSYGSQGLSTGAKIGIGVGVPAAVAVLVAVAFLLWRKRSQHAAPKGEAAGGHYEAQPTSDLTNYGISETPIEAASLPGQQARTTNR